MYKRQAELRSRVHAHLEMKKQKDMLNRQNKELLTNMEKLNFMAFRDGPVSYTHLDVYKRQQKPCL